MKSWNLNFPEPSVIFQKYKGNIFHLQNLSEIFLIPKRKEEEMIKNLFVAM